MKIKHIILEEQDFDDDIQEGDHVISFHVDEGLPHFIIGTVIRIDDEDKEDRRYAIKAEYDVNCRNNQTEVFLMNDVVYPPVNGTPTLFGDVTRGVRKIR